MANSHATQFSIYTLIVWQYNCGMSFGMNMLCRRRRIGQLTIGYGQPHANVYT